MRKKNADTEKATHEELEEMEAMLTNANEEQLKHFVLFMTINMDVTKSIYNKFINAVGANKKSQALSLKAYCNIRPGLRFRYIDLLALSESYMMNYIPELIEAVERNDGPHATREVMLIASSMKIEVEDRCPFITTKGIRLRDKVFVNYILRMAGYEMKSKYFPEMAQSRKAWVKSHGFKAWTREERIIEVKFRVKYALEEAENKTDAKVKEVRHIQDPCLRQMYLESALNNII